MATLPISRDAAHISRGENFGKRTARLRFGVRTACLRFSTGSLLPFTGDGANGEDRTNREKSTNCEWSTNRSVRGASPPSESGGKPTALQSGYGAKRLRRNQGPVAFPFSTIVQATSPSRA